MPTNITVSIGEWEQDDDAYRQRITISAVLPDGQMCKCCRSVLLWEIRNAYIDIKPLIALDVWRSIGEYVLPEVTHAA